jgi:hypothetical protein
MATPTSPNLQTAENRDRNSPGASHWRSPGLPGRHRCRGDLAQAREVVRGFENFDLQQPIQLSSKWPALPADLLNWALVGATRANCC